MSRTNKSVGKNVDWPQLEIVSQTNLSAGTGNDPANDTFIASIPDLSYINPTLKNLGGIAPQLSLYNAQWLRHAAFTNMSGSDVLGAANNFDWRINLYRNGTLQGCLAYYPMTVSTTLTPAITAANQNTYVTMTPAATAGIVNGMYLEVDTGGSLEVIQVTGWNGATFSAYFTKTHTTGFAVKSYLGNLRPTPFLPALAPNAISSNSPVYAAGSATIVPNSIYGFHVNDWIAVTGGGTAESGLAPTISSTNFTATFAQPHAGTSTVGYYIATTSSTAITGGSTTAITVASGANIANGDSIILHGTGADSAKTDTVTVSAGGGTTSLTLSAAPTNSYSATINITSVAYLSATTTTVANIPGQVIAMASTTGIAAGDLVALQNLTGNSATAAFTGSPEIVYVQAVVLNTSITISPTAVHTNAFAVIPFTKTTSVTAVTAAGSATIVLTSATNFATGLSNVYVWGGTAGVTENAQVTAVTGSTATLTFANSHIGAYTLAGGAQSILNNVFGVNQPFTIKGGDVLTLQRVSNNATGLASPAGTVQIEFVPAVIGA